MPVVLEVKDLVMRYPGASCDAVAGISFAIPEGSCFGLLGPNGAGKTTTLEIIEGVKRASSGIVLYRGEPVGPAFRERTGIQFQETSLQEKLTVGEVLRLFSSFYDSAADLGEVVRLCALEDLLDRDTRKLSGGQRQRLLLGLALVNDPDLVFLDEPTTGLDPQARRNFWDLIRGIKARGKTVVLTTHYMEEAYMLCDDIAIIDMGKIIARGEPDRLLKEHFDGVSIELPEADCKLEGGKVPGKVFTRAGRVEIMTTDVRGTLDGLLRSGSRLTDLKVRPRTLEDLFLSLTGRDLRDE
ncbi:MAG: ABC transporter ATP-binding protein [Elusimicrobiota bacterium]